MVLAKFILIHFVGAIPGHDQCIRVCQVLCFHILPLKMEMVSAKLENKNLGLGFFFLRINLDYFYCVF